MPLDPNILIGRNAGLSAQRELGPGVTPAIPGGSPANSGVAQQLAQFLSMFGISNPYGARTDPNWSGYQRDPWSNPNTNWNNPAAPTTVPNRTQARTGPSQPPPPQPPNATNSASVAMQQQMQQPQGAMAARPQAQPSANPLAGMLAGGYAGGGRPAPQAQAPITSPQQALAILAPILQAAQQRQAAPQRRGLTVSGGLAGGGLRR